MDFEDRLRAEGCTLKPAEFRRAVLDTFGEMYEPDELQALLDGDAEPAVFCAFVREVPGCEDVPDGFIVETLGRLLSGDDGELTPTEVWEVAEFHRRQRGRANAELKRMVSLARERYGDAFLSQLPPGVTVDASGEVHVEGEGADPLDTRLN
jgi:hypothetical protein